MNNKTKTGTKKILAINFGGIGDEILFFPTLKTLKASGDNIHLTLVVESRSKSAKNLTQLVDEILTCDIKGKNKYFNIFKLLLKIWIHRYDMVVSSGSSNFVAVLLFLTGIGKRYGYDSGSLSRLLLTKAIPLNKQQYAANMYHDLTGAISETSTPDLPEVDVLQESIDWANEQIGERNKKVIVIHPGVSAMSIRKNIIKFWTAENWAELTIKLLSTGNYKIILVGGPDDEEVFQKVRTKLVEHQVSEDDLIDMYGKTKNISRLAALTKLADLLVCVDSAPMHIGVGTRTPTVAIFGPTDEEKLLPIFDNRFIAVKNNVECRPCLWDKRQTSCDKLDCLNINPETVFNVIQQF